MALSLLDDGNTGVIVGQVTASGTTPSITTTDGAVTVAGDGSGAFTITYGSNFLSAPYVFVQVTDDNATYSTDALHGATVLSVATDTCVINTFTAVTNGTASDILSPLAELDFQVLVIGKRDR